MVAHTSIRRVQEWLGHSDLHSTMRYLHYTPRHDDVQLVARAFGLPSTANASVREPGR